MDESEFKKTHRSVNETPCAFAKAILRRCGQCSRARKLLIAERESVACNSPAAQQQCEALKGLLREKALFALQIKETDEPLPHGKEIKAQCGGLIGLRDVLAAAAVASGGLDDIHGMVTAAAEHYGDLESLPFTQVMRGVVHYQTRRRERR